MEYIVEVHAANAGEISHRVEECDAWLKDYYASHRNGNPRSGWARTPLGSSAARYRIIGDERMAMLFKLQFCGT